MIRPLSYLREIRCRPCECSAVFILKKIVNKILCTAVAFITAGLHRYVNFLQFVSHEPVPRFHCRSLQYFLKTTLFICGLAT